jgi:trigger factor
LSAATVKHIDPTQVELEIAIEQSELVAARERAFRQLVKNVRIPGFRPGKAPRKIFEAQYGTAGIEERAMDAVVPDAYSKALQDNDLEPVDRPQMELLPEEEGQPLRVRATVSVRPQIELADYKGIALSGSSTAVGASDVEDALAGLRKDAGTLVPVDRPVALGDTPTLDYLGKIDGVAFEGGTADSQPTEIDAARFIPGFADGIVGMTAGETRDVEAQFPADYQNAELAGKTAIFTVKVHENKTTELPEIDDAFAVRIIGEGGTVATLRDDLRSRIETHRRSNVRRELAGDLMEKLLEANDFPLPAVLVDREVEALAKEARGYVEQAGVEWDAYLKDRGKTEEELHAEYRSEAEKRVKTSLLIEAIAKAEKIFATEADVEAEIASLARQYRQPREAILEMLRPNIQALVDGVVRTKTVEFLLDQATISETLPPEATSAPQT